MGGDSGSAEQSDYNLVIIMKIDFSLHLNYLQKFPHISANGIRENISNQSNSEILFAKT